MPACPTAPGSPELTMTSLPKLLTARSSMFDRCQLGCTRCILLRHEMEESQCRACIESFRYDSSGLSLEVSLYRADGGSDQTGCGEHLPNTGGLLDPWNPQPFQYSQMLTRLHARR